MMAVTRVELSRLVDMVLDDGLPHAVRSEAAARLARRASEAQAKIDNEVRQGFRAQLEAATHSAEGEA